MISELTPSPEPYMKNEPLPDDLIQSDEKRVEKASFPCPCGKTFERLCGTSRHLTKGLKSHIKMHKASGHKLILDEWFYPNVKISVKADSERNFVCGD
jgi:hypothetical protein